MVCSSPATRAAANCKQIVLLPLRPDNAVRHLCMWRPRRGWKSGGATRCSITEEVRRRAALQPLNDPELLVGWEVLAMPKRIRVGSVEEVIYTGEGAAPLLRVVNSDPNRDPASGVAAAPGAREEHLVPFVREIVPTLEPKGRIALLQPPPGLLELGRRRSLLERLRPQLLEIGPAGSAPGAPQYMPSRKALEQAGRADLVRGVMAAGGFLAVAQELGLRARRRPQGYWDSLENLEQELSEFVASSWAELRDDDSGATYFYNQVTGRISWERPTPLQRVPLSEEAGNGDWLVVEDERDRVVPSRKALMGAGRYDLHHAIQFWGGYRAVAEVLERPHSWPRPLPDRHALRAELRAVSQVLFYGYQCWRYRVLNAPAPPGAAAVPPEDVAQLQERLLGLADAGMTAVEYFSGWFRGAPPEAIRRGNVEEFLAYGFHCRPLADLSGEDREALGGYIDRIEQLHGEKFGKPAFLPGRAPGLAFMAHLWEPLPYFWKPLAVHLAAEGMRGATCAALLALGFRASRCRGFRYWVKAPRGGRALSLKDPRTPCSTLIRAVAGGAAPNEADGGRAAAAPLLFLHGVGLGLTPYLHFLLELGAACPGRPMVLLEAPHVSVGLTPRAVAAEAVAIGAAAVLARHGWAQAAVVAHSYGTFVASHLLRLHCEMVQAMVLIDPVAMLTCHPQLLSTFVYKPPDVGSLGSLLGVVDSFRYLFSRDLTIAHAFCRQFVWHRDCLWPQDLPPASLLVLAARDDLVPSALVLAHLAALGHPARVNSSPAGHGAFLLNTAWRKRIVADIRLTLDEGAAAAVAKAALGQG
ncbi:hypothetical protein WJX81_002392 [Elliptochloris bilobata]|uniref:WW domain-containing protein n=1 Tax=Elliptochloris bilobata TaxID=381761 RepID=A0AAW1R357_9CHLO